MLITDSGRSLCESLIITRYLNDFSGGGLLPSGTAELERCLAIESVASVLMDSLCVRSFEKNQREASTLSEPVLERECARSRRCYDALEEAVNETITPASIAVISLLTWLCRLERT